MNGADGLPFHRLMALGLGALGWAPGTFWAATPMELNAALAGRFPRARRASQAVARTEFEALKARHPDDGNGS